MADRSAERPYVVVKMEVLATVQLPPDRVYDGQVCDDPAVEAALESLPQQVDVYVWGEQRPPARVWLEAHEEDVEIEEDHR